LSSTLNFSTRPAAADAVLSSTGFWDSATSWNVSIKLFASGNKSNGKYTNRILQKKAILIFVQSK
jgi:hypothetical protein